MGRPQDVQGGEEGGAREVGATERREGRGRSSVHTLRHHRGSIDARGLESISLGLFAASCGLKADRVGELGVARSHFLSDHLARRCESVPATSSRVNACSQPCLHGSRQSSRECSSGQTTGALHPCVGGSIAPPLGQSKPLRMPVSRACSQTHTVDASCFSHMAKEKVDGIPRTSNAKTARMEAGGLVNVPALAPLQALVALDVARVAPVAVSAEPPKRTADREHRPYKHGVLDGLRQGYSASAARIHRRGGSPYKVVQQMREHQHGKVQDGQVVVQIAHARHDQERHIVQRPPERRDFRDVEEMRPVRGRQIVDTSLTSHHVPQPCPRKHHQRRRRSPPYDRVADQIILDRRVVPRVHAQSIPQPRPVERLARQNVLLVRVRDERIVRGHHRHVEVDKVAQEGRAVELLIARRQTVVPVVLNVPPRMLVLGVVLLIARHLDLLPAPLRQHCIRGAQLDLAQHHVVHHLDHPVVVVVAHLFVAIARHFEILLGDGRGKVVRVDVALGLVVDEADDVAVLDHADRLFGARVVGGQLRLVPGRRDDELVVVVAVVVARHLLLLRADGVGLDVRVQQSAAVAHVFERDLGAKGGLGRGEGKVVAAQVALEERAHLGIARARTAEDGKVRLEAQHVDGERQEDEAEDACAPVTCVRAHGHAQVAELLPQVLDGEDADEGGDKEADPLDGRDAADGGAGPGEPEPPRPREGRRLVLHELDEAVHGGEGEAEQHGVEEDEARDDEPAVVEEHHDGEQVSCAPVLETGAGEPGERHHGDAKHGEDDAHADVVDVGGVLFARLEFELAAVAADEAGEADEHLAERRMHVKVELLLKIVGAELAKVRLVPDDDVGATDLPETRDEREDGVDEADDLFLTQRPGDEVQVGVALLVNGDEVGVLVDLCGRRRRELAAGDGGANPGLLGLERGRIRDGGGVVALVVGGIRVEASGKAAAVGRRACHSARRVVGQVSSGRWRVCGEEGVVGVDVALAVGGRSVVC
ncbi:hypothetical protein L1887_54220 [Cichorium endivia]|nr:hypothetical protein L1887_54220 [Cichorium endivia]